MGWLRGIRPGAGLCALWMCGQAMAQPVVVPAPVTEAPSGVTESAPQAPAAPPAAPGAPAAESAAAPAAERVCRPNCRVGFLCLEGICVSECNPPCPAGDECTADLRCERRAPPAWERPQHYEPEPDLSIRRHDGFYLSLEGGGGFTYAHFGNPNVLGAGGFAFAIGGSPSPGVAIAYSGRWFGFGSGRLINVSGVLVDVHPDPHGGLHIGTTFGWSVLVDVDSDYYNFVPVGFGLAPEVGYDLWIGEQWSTGLTARMLMFLQRELAMGFSLGIRFLYH